MKIAEAEILFIGEKENDGDDHWQNRWIAKLSTAKYIWTESGAESPNDCIEKCVKAIEEAKYPLVIVAHCLGCLWFLQALEKHKEKFGKKIVGAFLVAPSVSSEKYEYPNQVLPCLSYVLGSDDDQLCPIEHSRTLARGWGSVFVEGRENGHFNTKSGHGPWPEGLMVFAEMMKKIRVSH